jgi:hypothetical protein
MQKASRWQSGCFLFSSMPESSAFSGMEENKKLNAQRSAFCIMTPGDSGITQVIHA